MYKLALVLSTTPSVNVFRAALHSAFNSCYFDDFLICSGFFHQRSTKKGSFFASDAFSTAVLPHPSTVTVVGSYDPASTEFADFVNTLVSSLRTTSGSPVSVSKRFSKKKYANHWHAKIFIARRGDEHSFAVIGSSNLTRHAFNIKASNNEADVIIWNEDDLTTKSIVESAFSLNLNDQNNMNFPTIIIANYDQDSRLNSFNADMNERLAQLWRDVISVTR